MISKENFDFLDAHRRNRPYAFLLLLSLLAVVARLSVFVRQRSGEFYSSVDTAAFVQILLISIICFILPVSPLKKYAFRIMGRTSARAFLWFCVIGVFSALWSSVPQFSLYRSVEFFSQFFAVFVALLYFKSFLSTEKAVLWVSTISVLLMAGMHLRFYGLSFSPAHWHTNTYSASAAMLFCYVAGEMISNSRKVDKSLYAFGGIGLFFLLIGTSSGSNIAAICAIAVVCLLCRNLKIFFLVVMVGVLGFVVIDWQELFAMIFPGKSMSGIQSMTGRVGLWEMYIYDYFDQPFLGSGFAVTSRLAAHYNTNMHNGFMGALFGTGALGMFFYVVAMLRLMREFFIAHIKPKPGAIGCIAALVAGFANNMTVSIVGEQWAQPTLTLIAFWALHTYVYKGVWQRA